MEFYEVLSKRRSIRAYTDLPIPEDSLRRITRAVLQAPSACNRQPYRFLLVSGEAKNRILSVAPQAYLRDAPIIVVAVGEKSRAWQRPGDDHTLVELDLGIAMEHLVLAAAAEGLGTCWIAAFDVQDMNDELELSGGDTVIAISPLGYPAEEPRIFQRGKSEQDLFIEINK